MDDMVGMVSNSGEMGKVQIAVLKKAQDLQGAAAQQLIASLPQSPNPAGIGGNFDATA